MRSYERDELLLTLIAPEEVLREILAVEVAGSCCRLDHGAGLVRHAGHTDPIVEVDDGGHPGIQIFLHDVPSDATPEIARLVTAQGSLQVSLRNVRLERGADMQSRLNLGNGPPSLEVRSNDAVEIIEQRMILGRFAERRRFLPPGLSVTVLEPGFADAFGVVVSSVGIHGGSEHKHQILGRFGYPSGRILLTGGNVVGSGQTGPHAFRSAVAPVDDLGRPGGFDRPWEHADEIEAWAPAHLSHQAARLLADCPVPWAVMTFGRERGQVTVVDPGDTPPSDGRPYSFCLFADAERFAERLRATLEWAHDPANIDRAWLSAEEAPFSAAPRYGIAWSLPETSDEADVARSRAREVRHRATGIVMDEWVFSRLSGVPLPHPGGEPGFLGAIRAMASFGRPTEPGSP